MKNLQKLETDYCCGHFGGFEVVISFLQYGNPCNITKEGIERGEIHKIEGKE